jgi:hypothetical protein
MAEKNRTVEPEGRVARRGFLKTLAAGAAVVSTVGFPHVARAQTKLAMALWDHWVPGANDVSRSVITEWGRANKVDVTVDYITSIGNKLQLTGAAEYRARAGHDIIAFVTWDGTFYRDRLEPMNDVAEAVIKQYGPYNDNARYINFQDGRWITVPSPLGSHTYPLETRMDLWKQHAGIDVQDVFPADVKKRDKAKVDASDWKQYLEAAKKVNAAGFPVGHPISECTDANDWLGPLFAGHGSFPMNDKGDITIESDGTLEAIEYVRELAQQMPKDVFGWDDAGNNRWLISGKGSSISNPPSAWTVAKRDRPDVAAQVWHHDMPRGPKGRFRGSLPYTWGVWDFSRVKKPAKDLLLHLSQREVQFKLITASQGYDMPQLDSYLTHPIWTEIGPPPGTQYNYPVRGDEKLIVAGWPARPDFGAQIYSRWLFPIMVGRTVAGGMSARDAVKWAAGELEGYKRG